MTRDEAMALTVGAIVRHRTTGRLYRLEYLGADEKLAVRTQRQAGGDYDGPMFGLRASDCTLVTKGRRRPR